MVKQNVSIFKWNLTHAQRHGDNFNFYFIFLSASHVIHWFSYSLSYFMTNLNRPAAMEYKDIFPYNQMLYVLGL